MVYKHGHRKSRKDPGCSPSKWSKWLVNWGDPKDLLRGMILQVTGGEEMFFLLLKIQAWVVLR